MWKGLKKDFCSSFHLTLLFQDSFVCISNFWWRYKWLPIATIALYITMLLCLGRGSLWWLPYSSYEDILPVWTEQLCVQEIAPLLGHGVVWELYNWDLGPFSLLTFWRREEVQFRKLHMRRMFCARKTADYFSHLKARREGPSTAHSVWLGVGKLCKSGSLGVVPPHLSTCPLFCSSKLNGAALRETRLVC